MPLKDGSVKEITKRKLEKELILCVNQQNARLTSELSMHGTDPKQHSKDFEN